jgi:hypothetical protein
MKTFSLGTDALGAGVAVALLAGCGVLRQAQDDMQPPGAMPRTTIAMRAAQRSGFGIPAPVSAKSGIYVSENLSSRSDVFGYANNNRSNGPPICSENASSTYDLAVDDKGDLIVPEYNAIAIFKGPSVCGRKLGSLHTIWDDDYPVDATSPDAETGTIAVGVIQDAGSGVGSIELCTLKSGCKTNLTHGSAMNLVFAVAMSKKGDCWASSATPTALTYFRGCSGSGQPATGYANPSAGGLDIDKNGNLVSISCAVVSCSTPALYVYSGCKPHCKKIGGPFSMQGASMYGHLNEDSSRFATADYQYGQIDIYKYAPMGITYTHSFDNGLSAGARMGAAYNPRSRE